MSGRSQHVTIPAEFRFQSNQVSVHRDPDTGDLVLSEVPVIDDVYAALDAAQIPSDFMTDKDRDRRLPEERTAVDQIFEGDEARRPKQK